VLEEAVAVCWRGVSLPLQQPSTLCWRRLLCVGGACLYLYSSHPLCVGGGGSCVLEARGITFDCVGGGDSCVLEAHVGCVGGAMDYDMLEASEVQEAVAVCSRRGLYLCGFCVEGGRSLLLAGASTCKVILILRGNFARACAKGYIMFSASVYERTLNLTINSIMIVGIK
jgi:hypothetical protein